MLILAFLLFSCLALRTTLVVSMTLSQSVTLRDRLASNKFPMLSQSVTLRDRLVIDKFPIFTLGALGLGKRITDGPTFKESVSLNGQTIVITGANSGLGKEAAIKLASLDAKKVIILCRNPVAAAAAITEIDERSKTKGLVSTIPLDLGDLKSIEKCVAQLKSEVGNIDVLMNNAGVMAIPTRETTEDGFERQIGINHLGHYALTLSLLKSGLIKSSSSGGTARIINVSSVAHQMGNLEKVRDDLFLEKPKAYTPWGAYGNSKLANVLFTRELARRLSDSSRSESDSRIATFTLHPGVCRTELYRYLTDIPKILYPLVGAVALPAIYLTKSAKQGAQTQIFLAASNKINPAADSGKYFDNSREVSTSKAAQNMETASWLWQESARLTGINL